MAFLPTTFNPQGGERLVDVKIGTMVQSDDSDMPKQVQIPLSNIAGDDVYQQCDQVNFDIRACQRLHKEFRLVVARVERNKIGVEDHLKLRATNESIAFAKERANTANRNTCIIITDMEVVPEKGDTSPHLKRFNAVLYPQANFGFIKTSKVKPEIEIHTDTHRPIAIPTAA